MHWFIVFPSLHTAEKFRQAIVTEAQCRLKQRGFPNFIAERWLGAKRKRISLLTYQRRNRYTR